MSTTHPSRLEAMAVCQYHLEYYRKEASKWADRREYGKSASATSAADAVNQIMGVLTGKVSPLGARKE